MKKSIFLIPVLALALIAPAQTVFAKGWGGHGGDSLEHKVFKKVMMIKQHQGELKFSDEDVQKATDLKTALKKDLIKLNAELDLVKLDLQVAHKASKLDVGAMNKLIDQKYEIKKKKAKRALQAYAEVRAMFSDDQKSKMKEIFAGQMKGRKMHMKKGYFKRK